MGERHRVLSRADKADKPRSKSVRDTQGVASGSFWMQQLQAIRPEREAGAQICLECQTRKPIFDSGVMGSHWKLWTGREMNKAVSEIKSDSSVQNELLWQSFLCSLAQLWGNGGTKLGWWEEQILGGRTQKLSYHSAWLLIRMNSEKHQHTAFCHYFEDTVSTLLFITSASLGCAAQIICSSWAGHIGR